MNTLGVILILITQYGTTQVEMNSMGACVMAKNTLSYLSGGTAYCVDPRTGAVNQ